MVFNSSLRGDLRENLPYPLRKMWEIGRRVFYSALGLLGNLCLGPLSAVDPFEDREISLARVAVLGRGKSSKLFDSAAEKKNFSAVILCNFENRELASSELIEAIRLVPIVILLTQLGEPAPTFRVAKSVGVNYVMIVRRNHDARRKRKIWRLNRLGLPVQTLPDSLSEDLNIKTKGTGIVGVAIGSLLSKNVEVFGIEFYRTDYISSGYEDTAQEFREKTHLRPKSKYEQRSHEYRDSFEQVAAHQASTHFTLHCFEDHSMKLDNVRIRRVASEA